MTRPGIEPRSPGPLPNPLPNWAMSRLSPLKGQRELFLTCSTPKDATSPVKCKMTLINDCPFVSSFWVDVGASTSLTTWSLEEKLKKKNLFFKI